MKKRRKMRKFKLFPSLVSDHPKKIIAVIILFTLFMGYFASQMNMNTTEGAFNPESEKGEWLDQVRDEFGTSEETVQIAFVADNGDVFTQDVLLDIMETKMALKEDEEINQTLAESTSLSENINTLADTIIIADLTLEINDYVIDLTDTTNASLNTFEKQKEMYVYMNSSLSSAVYLTRSANPEVSMYSTTALTSMSDIISNPSSWMALSIDDTALQSHMKQLQSLLMDPNSSAQQLVSVLDQLVSDLEGYKGDVPGVSSFQSLFINSRDILNSSTDATEHQMTRNMLLSFLQVGRTLSEIEGNNNSLSFMQDFPTRELDDDEKKQKIENMSDSEIKGRVQDILEYDPEELNNSVETISTHLTSMGKVADNSIDILEEMNSTLGTVIQSLKEHNQTESAQKIADYQVVVATNRSTLVRTNRSIGETKGMMKSTSFLSSEIDNLANGIKMSVSKDFDPNGSVSTISADSCIGLVLMNSSIDGDKRLEAQTELIELSKEQCDSCRPRVFAGQVMMEQINDSANKGLSVLLPLAFLFVVIILFIVYRSLMETFVSLLALGFAILWTFGAGVLLGYNFNPMIIAVPILITGLVIDYGIHMVMRHREERGKGRSPSASTRIAIMTVGGALFLTTFTTVTGFLSNTFSSLQAMQQFGILAAVGISSSFILMVAGLPAVLQLVEERREEKKEEKKKAGIQKKAKKHGKKIIGKILSIPVDASDKHPVIVVIVVFLITSMSIYGVLNIDTTFDIQDFLPEDKSQSENIKYVSNNFNISTSYAYILTEPDNDHTIDSSEYLYAVHETTENIRGDEMVANDGEEVESPLSVMQSYGTATPASPYYIRLENSTHTSYVELFKSSDLDGDSIPDENITLLYDILYESDESKDAIRGVLKRDEDGRYTSAIIKVKENAEKVTKNLDNAEELENELEEDSEPLREEGFTAKITSGTMIAQQTTEELNETQIKGLITTIIIVAIVLSIVFYFLHRSIPLGVITTAPVTIITLWIVGTMYLFDISLNVMTVSITALTVGMGVDYSIHVTHRFTEEISDGNGLYHSMHETIQNTGAALFGSAATTIGAFGILGTSEILPLAQFGMITAMAIGYSFLASVFVLPSGLMLWAKYSGRGKKSRKRDLPVLKKGR